MIRAVKNRRAKEAGLSMHLFLTPIDPVVDQRDERDEHEPPIISFFLPEDPPKNNGGDGREDGCRVESQDGFVFFHFFLL